jgi:hemoglobin-like flavoprotein
MTPEQIRYVQTTWLKMLTVQDAAAQCFYDRLFELDPALRKLFPNDSRSQGRKLIQVIDAAVNGLDRFEHVLPAIQALGSRHADYGVKDEHYGTVGAALLWTLGKTLGAEFTPQAKDAWAAVYGALATTMREAAHTFTAVNDNTAGDQPHGLRNARVGTDRRRRPGDQSQHQRRRWTAPTADCNADADTGRLFSFYSQYAAGAGNRRRCRAVTLGGSTAGTALWAAYHGTRQRRAAARRCVGAG